MLLFVTKSSQEMVSAASAGLSSERYTESYVPCRYAVRTRSLRMFLEDGVTIRSKYLLRLGVTCWRAHTAV